MTVAKMMRLTAHANVLTALSMASIFGIGLSASAADLSSYTPIPNVVPSQSYIRFFGGDGTDYQVRAFGNKSGQEYTNGDMSVAVPVSAAPQVSFDALDNMAKARGAAGLKLRKKNALVADPTDDTALVLYVKGGDGQSRFFQHVLYNSDSGMFENMSVCSYNPLAVDPSSVNVVLMNVHTSNLNVYPSTVGLNNPDGTDRRVSIFVYNASTGSLVGTTIVTVPANGASQMSMLEIQNLVNWTPGKNDTYANLTFQSADDGKYTAIPTHVVNSLGTGAVTNLTQICPVIATIPGAPLDQCNPKDDGIAQIGELMDGCTTKEFPASVATKGRLGGVDARGAGGVNGQIYPAGDVDWYKVDVSQGSQYRFNVMGIRASLILGQVQNAVLRVRDQNGNVVSQGAASNQVDYAVPTNANQPQVMTYYLEVFSSNPTAVGGYQVSGRKF